MSTNTVRTPTKSEYASFLPPRARDAHKYSHGKVLIVGGSPRYVGAPILAIKGASRAGAGFVSSIVPEPILPLVQLGAINAPAEGAYPIKGLTEPCAIDGEFDTTSVKLVHEKSKSFDAVVVGPGMGLGSGAWFIVRDLIDWFSGPLIIDADAITNAARDIALVENERDNPTKMRSAAYSNIGLQTTLMDRTRPSIITPHRGEAERLAETFNITLYEDPVQAASQLAEELNCTVIFKGPHTIVANSAGITRCPVSTPALATAGTGDVLSGVLGSLAAVKASSKGITPLEDADLLEVASLGVYLHARAGEIAAEEQGEVSVIAQDVVEALPRAFKELLS